jgi:dTDP-4-amino-4,6-dideoxygalactose transaminase
VRLNRPLLGEDELAEVAAVLDSGFLTQGPRAAEFERLVRGVTGSAHAFATSSATTGLHIVLHALGIGPGDEVVIPDFSFPATANAVIQTGAVPVFVDIEPRTFNLDPDRLEAAIGPRTRAIMPVHAFGLCADMDRISAIAGDIPVVEDAACALAATYHGRAAGALGTAGVFSFHPRKIITTGEGGMVTTDDDALADRLAVLRTHGGVRGELYLDFVDAGFNYRMSDVHAALGIAQMRRLSGMVSERRRLAAALGERLAAIEGVTPPLVPEGHEHSYQSFVVLLDDDIDRDKVIRGTRGRDVETTLGTYSMHLQPYFRDRFAIPDAALPRATRAHRQALTLPLYPGMSESDLDLVAEVLALAIRDAR